MVEAIPTGRYFNDKLKHKTDVKRNIAINNGYLRLAKLTCSLFLIKNQTIKLIIKAKR